MTKFMHVEDCPCGGQREYEISYDIYPGELETSTGPKMPSIVDNVDYICIFGCGCVIRNMTYGDAHKIAEKHYKDTNIST